MYNNINKLVLSIFSAIFALLFSSVSFAVNDKKTCPILSSDIVQEIIENGNIETDPSYTLANEAGLTPEEVIAQEPTANPYDTFYAMYALKQIDSVSYLIGVANVLGKDNIEARNRTKKIILGDKYYTAQYDDFSKACIYKFLDASPSIPEYPFKSKYESVALFALDMSSVAPTLFKSIQKNRVKG